MYTVELPISGFTLQYDSGAERWRLLQPPGTGPSQWPDAGPKTQTSFIDIDRPGREKTWVAFGNLAAPGPVHVTFDDTAGIITTHDGAIWASESAGPMKEIRTEVAGQSHRLNVAVLAKMRPGH